MPMVTFLKSSELAKHLAFHVLTPDESHAWGIVWSGQFACLADSEEASQVCYRLRKGLERLEAWEQSPATPLAERYLKSITDVFRHSAALGWQVMPSGCLLAMDTNGIIGVFDIRSRKPTVITAFIPGFGSVAGTVRAQTTQNFYARVIPRSAMRRESRTEYGGGSEHDGVWRRMARKRAATWSPEQRIFYLVFRPVFQFIRRFQPGRDAVSSDLVFIKTVLPPMSQLSWDSWQVLHNMEVKGE